MPAWIGWVATAVFTVSYFCRDQAMMRRVQAAAALLWVAYGVGIGARPIIVANLIVAGVAGWSTLRLSARPAAPPDPRDPVTEPGEA